MKSPAVYGEMAERLKTPVLKTGAGKTCRGFESHSLRHVPVMLRDKGLSRQTNRRKGGSLMKDPEEYHMVDEDELIQNDSPGFPMDEPHRVYNHSPLSLPWYPSGFT